jgi:hypothetical protein
MKQSIIKIKDITKGLPACGLTMANRCSFNFDKVLELCQSFCALQLCQSFFYFDKVYAQERRSFHFRQRNFSHNYFYKLLLCNFGPNLHIKIKSIINSKDYGI